MSSGEPHRDPAPVVAGVDGSASARDALDWAAAEAAARTRPLWLVHACPPPVAPGSLGPAPRLGPDAGTDSGVLQEAARRARLVAPEVEVTTRLVFADPTAAIVAQRAELIVVGSRGLGAVRGALTGSVSVAVCTRARCPVAVVKPLRAMAPGPSQARVIVGVDGSDLSTPAIGFALRAAAQRGLGLTALHAWTPWPPADIDGLGDEWAASEAAARHRLDRTLARWRNATPAATITPQLVRDDPAHALAVESVGAALVVVGSRGRGGLTRLLFGSVSHAVVHDAHCPVAVIRPQTVTARVSKRTA